MDTAANIDEVWEAASRWQDEGHGVAIATVTRTWGSSPRQVGSQLVVDETSRFVGSVSGGCVEGEVIHAGLETIADGKVRQLSFGVSNAEAWAVGLACGGTIDILVERLDR